MSCEARSMYRGVVCGIVSVLVCIMGCTHGFLQRNTIRQVSTLTDLLYQQVLDNAAMFATCPQSLPHFAVIGDGTAQTSDQGTANGALTWNAFTITSEVLGGSANRQLMENWKLSPVMTAGRLRRMRCAFQLVFRPPALQIQSVPLPVPSNPPDAAPPPLQAFFLCDYGCIHCLSEMVSMGLLPSPDRKMLHSKEAVKAAEDLSPGLNVDQWLSNERLGPFAFKRQDAAEAYLAKVISQLRCNFPTDWCCIGRKHNVPKNACYVGRYGDAYAWVEGECIEALSRFTITILALATQDPPAAAAFTLTRKIDEKGNQTYKVSGSIPGDVVTYIPIDAKTLKPIFKQTAEQLGGTSALKAMDAEINRTNTLQNLLERMSEQNTFSVAELMNLKTQIEGVKRAAVEKSNRLAPADSAALLKSSDILAPAYNAIIEALQPSVEVVPSQPRPFDQPGSMPLSRPVGGIEFVPPPTP